MGLCGGFGGGSCGGVGAVWGRYGMRAIMSERTRIFRGGTATLEILLKGGGEPRETLGIRE